jgi:uncharacterized protein (TIGR03435 family)
MKWFKRASGAPVEGSAAEGRLARKACGRAIQAPAHLYGQGGGRLTNPAKDHDPAPLAQARPIPDALRIPRLGDRGIQVGIESQCAVSDNLAMASKLLSVIGVCLAVAAGPCFAQAPAAGPSFDVASIKPSPEITAAMVASGAIHAGMKIDASRVDIGQYPLMAIICKAYDVKQFQVSGPPWLTAQRFDIVAKMPEGATKEQVPQMLQALLAERFKLKVHHESKEQSVYALVVAKGGSKLKASEPDPIAPAPADPGAPAPPASTGSNQVTVKATSQGGVTTDGEGRRQSFSLSPDGKTVHVEASKVTMAQFADGLSNLVGRPVVDATELKGNYQLALDLSREDLMNANRAQGVPVPNESDGKAANPAAAASDPSGGSSVFNAIQTLGLKLEPRKTTLDRLIVDSMEKTPTDN